MYVCVCFCVREQDIKEYKAQGLSLFEIIDKLKVTTNCGVCEETVRSVFYENVKED